MNGLSLDIYPKGPIIRRSKTIRQKSLYSEMQFMPRSSFTRTSTYASLTPSMASVLDKKVKISSCSTRDQINKYVGRRNFVTGSEYDGEYDSVDICGRGVYTCMTGTKRSGYFQEGFLYGGATLSFPNGALLGGCFNNGQFYTLEDYVFADGCMLKKDYISKLDRRFYTELANGLQPAGRSYKTNQQPTREIPRGCYDVIDGFYNPIHKCVYDYDDPEKVVRIPTKNEHDWIIKNCRKSFDEYCGYKPELYENWQVKGTVSEESKSSTEDMQSYFCTVSNSDERFSPNYKLNYW